MRYRLTHAVGSTTVQTTQTIREAVAEAFRNPDRIDTLPPLTVVTVDHYTTKWAVAAIEWLRRRRIVDHILKQPSRVCIQVLEGGILPRGRFQFYNGVGAVADMVAHLMQPLRALTGHASVKDLLETMRIVEIRRARYDVPDDYSLEAFGTSPVEATALSEKLAKDTDTFGLIRLEFTGPPWDGTPVYIRTGKGFVPSSKTMIVESFDADGPVALICDIDNKRICLADNRDGTHQREQGEGDHELPQHVWMWTREFDVPGLVRDHSLTPGSDEYVEIFSALCDWESPDHRFFPSIEDATFACDFFYRELIRDRTAYPKGLVGENVYPPDYFGGEVRGWLGREAGWTSFAVEGD